VPAQFDGEKYALLIGVADYRLMRPLSKSTVDATDLHGLLDQCGYAKANMRLLLDTHATKSSINEALDNLARRTNDQDTVVLFFSGHGVQRVGGFEPGEYICPATADATSLHATAISNQELTLALGAIRARRVVLFLDACHSGGVGEPKDPALAMQAGLSEETYTQLSAVGMGRVVIASCKPDEVSWELKHMRNSLFSHYLLEGLRGAAASDDGAVRIFDLFDFIASEVPRTAPVAQTPLMKANTNMNFPIIQRTSEAAAVGGLP